MAEEIQYSDGSIESEILERIRKSSDLSSDSAIAREHYDRWPIRYHLCPERSNLLRSFDFTNLDVLEIGAGLGAISRYLAEKSKSLVAVEGTQMRLDALKERLRDLNNWTGLVGNLEKVELNRKFDVVCSIGVLEYSEMFLTPPEGGGTAFDAFLKVATGHLNDDGVLILAIENKLGMKYWSGAGEDHSSGMFDGICGYPRTHSAKTFSQNELLHLLETHGLSVVDRYYPFPDYKVPTSVMSSKFIDEVPAIAANLASHQAFENYGAPRVTYFPELLALKSVADAGLLESFSNSFLFVASKNRESVTRLSLQKARLKRKELAWHYSLSRRIPCKTVFLDSESGVRVKKVSLNRVKSYSCSGAEGMEYEWEPLSALPVTHKENLRFLLAREAYFANREGFVNYFFRFFSWAFETWPSEQWALSGECLDATVPNITCDTDGTGFEVFDLEWRCNTKVSKTWFIFRNLFGLFREVPLLEATGFHKLREVYEYFCVRFALLPDFERDLYLESTFQEAVTKTRTAETSARELHVLFDTPFVSNFPRSPSIESQIKPHLQSLEVESVIWNAPAHRLVRRANDQLKKWGPVHKWIKSMVTHTIGESS